MFMESLLKYNVISSIVLAIHIDLAGIDRIFDYFFVSTEIPGLLWCVFFLYYAL